MDIYKDFLKVPINLDSKSPIKNYRKEERFDKSYEIKGNWGFYSEDQNILVIDFDCRDGCKEDLREILIYDTRIVETLHGFHVYFRINGKLMKKKQTKNISYTRNKFYDKSETVMPDLLTGIDFLGTGQLVIGEGSIINGWEYKAINDLPIKTITNAEADLIKSKLLINKPKSLRRGFSEIFRGNIDPNKFSQETKEEEFKYWKWLYIEAWVIGGVPPEALFNGLERVNKGFDRETTEAQVVSPTNDPRNYNKVLSNEIYNRMFPDIKKRKKDRIKRRQFKEIVKEIEEGENWKNIDLFLEAIESSLNANALVWGSRKSELVKVSRKELKAGDIERQLKEMKKSNRPYILIVDDLKAEFDIMTMSDSKGLLIKTGNIYKKDFKGKIEKMISSKIREFNLSFKSTEANILGMLKSETLFDRDDLCYDDNKINFKNGYYDLEKGFCPSDDNIIFPFEIPHKWEDIKRDEYCPKYKEALSKWLGEDSVFIVDDMFEMIGYFMTLDNSLKKAFMIYGDQDSGKTQNLLIINHILGEENIARIELQRLDSDRFGTDGLEFKMVCEDDDLPKDRLKGASKFKKITGGMPYIGAEKKGGDKYNFRNTIRFIFNCNRIPKAYDEDDEAFFIRWVLINFHRPIPDDEQIPNFYKTITEDPEEVQGIIHESIEGIKRLKARGQFRDKVREDTREIWKTISNPLYNFIKTNCKKGPKEQIIAQEFLDTYNDYLLGLKKETITLQTLYRELEKLGFHKRRDHEPDAHGIRRYLIIGLDVIDWDSFTSSKKPNLW